MGINRKRFFFWMMVSLVLLIVVHTLFATRGVRPAVMGGTGESNAYACFLSVLYMLDMVCLCLITGMKRQPAFIASAGVISGLVLAIPEWWGAPYYGVVLLTGAENAALMIRLFAAVLLAAGIGAFAGGLALRKRGWGQPVRPEAVPSVRWEDVLRELEEEKEENENSQSGS